MAVTAAACFLGGSGWPSACASAPNTDPGDLRGASTSPACRRGRWCTRACCPRRRLSRSSPTCPTSATRRAWRSCTPGSPPTRSRPGRGRTRTGPGGAAQPAAAVADLPRRHRGRPDRGRRGGQGRTRRRAPVRGLAFQRAREKVSEGSQEFCVAESSADGNVPGDQSRCSSPVTGIARAYQFS